MRYWADEELEIAHPATPQVGIAEITPARAERWLTRLAPNRLVSDDRVKAMMRDIKEDRWFLNGESIKLDVDGNLSDGQHRLWAVFYAQRPIVSVVVLGVPREALPTIDVGRPRSFGDQLRILEGLPAAGRIAAIARMWLLCEAGKAPTTVRAIYTYAEVAAAVHRHRTSILEARTFLHSNRVRPLAYSGLLAFVFSAALEHNRPKGRSWAEAVSSGEGLEQGDPALVLRERLLALRGTRREVWREEVAAWIIKSWTAALAGRSLTPQGLTYRVAAGERFPDLPGVGPLSSIPHGRGVQKIRPPKNS